MLLGKVIGTAVATRKDPNLEGTKLQVVQLLDSAGRPQDRTQVAVDTVGAGVGETVILTIGSMSRFALKGKEAPTDAVIVGIVDHIEVEKEPTLPRPPAALLETPLTWD
ncbi:MAG: EutN/CcmL family microcompartment protein [Chloroflexi bacterium]|nr:EutN/CcmL family microcompartment protein [Chloroflexota bacterium]